MRPRGPNRLRRIHGLGRERQIADRDHAARRRILAQVGQRRVAPLVAEGVELFDVADLEAGLLGHEGPQRQFEGAVPGRIEGA